MMQIRGAVEADIDQVTEIFNEVLTNSTAISTHYLMLGRTAPPSS
jgi:L-amino acid N-acyltransferase YncA